MQFKVSAPGKIIISGQHSVVYNHDAICGSIALRCQATCSISPNKSDHLTINLTDINKIVNVNLNNLTNISSKQLNDAQQLYNYKISLAFSKISNLTSKQVVTKTILSLKQTHCHITIKSNIPIGKGLGSSAALSVCLASTLTKIVQKYSNVKINKKSINQLAYEFEKIYHSNPSGLDNTISLYGGLYRYNRQQELKEIKWNLSGINVGLVDSGIEKNTKKAVEHVRELYTNHNGKMIIEEIASVTDKIRECIQQGKEDEFLKLIKINHGLLRDLGLSNESIQKIVERLPYCSCKITGAGMGGQVLVFSKEKIEGNGVQWVRMSQQGVIIQQ